MIKEEDIFEIFTNEFGVDISNLKKDDRLFSTGLLDSLSSVKLLTLLEEKFNITISPLDVSLEDVDQVSKIIETIDRLKS
jgi:D-alanine--poly(phosphoribitol) ligase subunit 2